MVVYCVCTCVCSRNPNHCITKVIICQDPNLPSSGNPFSGRLSGTCCYAEADLERNPWATIPPPPVERVAYAEPVAVGEKEVSVCIHGHSVLTYGVCVHLSLFSCRVRHMMVKLSQNYLL